MMRRRLHLKDLVSCKLGVHTSMHEDSCYSSYWISSLEAERGFCSLQCFCNCNCRKRLSQTQCFVESLKSQLYEKRIADWGVLNIRFIESWYVNILVYHMTNKEERTSSSVAPNTSIESDLYSKHLRKIAKVSGKFIPQKMIWISFRLFRGREAKVFWREKYTDEFN